MKVGSQEFRDKVAATVSIVRIGLLGGGMSVHILQRGNEDVAQTDDLDSSSVLPGHKQERPPPTFSWRKCFNNFNSRYVRLDSTGVLKGFMIFLTATGDPVNWSLAALQKRVVNTRPHTTHQGRITIETYQTRPKAPIPTGCSSVYLFFFSKSARRPSGSHRRRSPREHHDPGSSANPTPTKPTTHER